MKSEARYYRYFFGMLPAGKNNIVYSTFKYFDSEESYFDWLKKHLTDAGCQRSFFLTDFPSHMINNTNLEALFAKGGPAE